MRIAIFDYKVIPTNPIGSCHHKLLKGLADDHEFTVFAVQFENPNPERIRFVKVPVPTRPLAGLFVAYHLVAPIVYAWHRLRHPKFDLIQTVESNGLIGCDVVYAHFCHRRFLKTHWPTIKTGGLRGFLRKADHWLHAVFEGPVFRKAGMIVVPSRGLARELAAEYPATGPKIRVLANPVDLDRMRRPSDFDRREKRSALGFLDDETVLLFVALGHFERKGLPLILEAMGQDERKRTKLNVVGGEPDLVNSWREKVAGLGLADRVVFSGMQKDVRPHFWAADVFLLPSVYEVFPLVSLEAAAAGVPMIVSPLNGVEEFLRDGENGILVERSAEGVRDGIERFLNLSREGREGLGRQAQNDVQPYSVHGFCSCWREAYVGAQERVLGGGLPHPDHRV